MSNLSEINTTDLLVKIAELQNVQASLVHWKEYTNANIDHFFRISLAIMIFLMQGGFAMLEAGCVRSKNATNILIKNLLDAFIAGFAYWLVGYAFALGEGNTFIGHTYFAHHDLKPESYSLWFFHYVFAATAATIVSGAVAERCDFIAYLIYSSIITGFIYPVLVHWAWTPEGWLAQGFSYDHNGETLTIFYRDFSGSGIVHMLSGLAALIGAKALGPRLGRYDDVTGEPRDIQGHSIVLSALGGFILLFGFLAFNVSAAGSLSGEGQGELMSQILVNTIMSGSAGGLVAMVIKYFKGDSKWNLNTTLNGALCAMCAICGPVDSIPTYTAVIIGAVGGVTYIFVSWFVLYKCRVDDPLDAVAVHLGGGLVGVISVAIFHEKVGIIHHWNMESVLTLAWQCVGILAVVTWTGGLCAVMFYSLKAMKILRVPLEFELKGIDLPKHGQSAYPAKAYGDSWGSETSDDVQEPQLKENPDTKNRTLNGSNFGASNGSFVSDVTTTTHI
ncbi:putative ammonium transporter 1 [Ylistrum balloti]|uniref:putative ammonium transporter 1 n=1 Tax=Ylistrum balloti TaxID=509963 RepID=UPI002905D1C3|nr:putative ammonium transporter 1 [Ylistrum balloti]